MGLLSDSQRWLILALVALTGWLIWLLAPILTPFVLSAVFAYLGDPITDRLQRKGLSRSTAVIIVFCLLSLAAVIALVVVIPLLIDQIQRLVQLLPSMLDAAGRWLAPLLESVVGADQAAALREGEWRDSELIQQLTSYADEVGSLLVPLLGGIGRGGAAVLTMLVNLALIPVVTFYLLRDWDHLISWIHEAIPRQYEPTVVKLASDSDQVLGGFLRGQLSVMIALGIIYSIGLWAIGLDLWVLIGMLAGLISFVPYLGTAVGLVAGLAAVMFQFGDLTHVLLVLAVFGAGQLLEGMVLTPLLVGDRIGLHPVAVIFAVLAGGQLFGFVGVLIGLPAAAVINVLLQYAHDRYLQSGLYGADSMAAADPAPDPAPDAEPVAPDAPIEDQSSPG